MELPGPINVEDRREVVWVAVEEILWWVARHELVTEFKYLEKRSSSPTCRSLSNLLNSLGPHQLAKPGGRSCEKAVPHHSEPGRRTRKISNDLPCC